MQTSARPAETHFKQGDKPSHFVFRRRHCSQACIVRSLSRVVEVSIGRGDRMAGEVLSGVGPEDSMAKRHKTLWQMKKPLKNE